MVCVHVVVVIPKSVISILLIIIVIMESNNEMLAEVLFEYTGKGCVVPKNVTIVRFHSSVIYVENNAFQFCKKMREVIFNDGLQKIGQYAFYCCSSLRNITFPSTVTEIGQGAFQSCCNLREVMLNKDLHNIEEFAFYDCKSLSNITIPSTVTEIGYAAFNRCSNLREVIFHGVPREIAKNAFYGCSSLERFAFPTISSRLNTLIRTGHWEEIENEVNEVRGVVERSGSEFFVSSEAMGEGRNWSAVRESLGKIGRLISCYELKEATSMLELALWKFKLDQVDKANPIPRKKCRMDVPGPVKDIIRQYLPYECLLPLSDV